MLPISSIPTAMPAYGLPSQVEMPSEMTPMQRPEGVSGTQPAQDSFSSMLGKFVGEVSAKQTDAASAVANLQGGGNVSLHQTVIAMEEANVSFQLMVEVRNKLMDAYQEVLRMQV